MVNVAFKPLPTRPSVKPLGKWKQMQLSSRGEACVVVERVCDEMRIGCYPNKDLFAVRLILEEGLVNAVKHGNGDDPGKAVTVRFCVTDDFVAMDIEDEGSGFNPNRIPDPLAPENLDKASGRGLLLMRTHSTCMRYSESGNRVSLIRFRSASIPSDGKLGSGNRRYPAVKRTKRARALSKNPALTLRVRFVRGSFRTLLITNCRNRFMYEAQFLNGHG